MRYDKLNASQQDIGANNSSGAEEETALDDSNNILNIKSAQNQRRFYQPNSMLMGNQRFKKNKQLAQQRTKTAGDGTNPRKRGILNKNNVLSPADNAHKDAT